MTKINLLYNPKKYFIDIKGNPKQDYPYGKHEFYSSFDFNKFLNSIDLSKYSFIARVE